MVHSKPKFHQVLTLINLTFKITGSFSCDELGSTDNVDVAQVMLAPKQKLTDGMLTDTSQNESITAPNADGNSISATIRNDGLQHQGHLTNPIFYMHYIFGR